MKPRIAARAILAVPFALWLSLGAVHAGECGLRDPRLVFCHGDTWTPRQSKNPEIVAAYRGGGSFRLSFILGNSGTDDGQTAESILAFQREVYATYARLQPADLPVLAEDSVEVSGVPGERQVFTVVIGGNSYVIAVSAFSLSDQNLQVITLERQRRFTDRHRTLHDGALAKLVYDPEAGT